jgi:hypothetical protein
MGYLRKAILVMIEVFLKGIYRGLVETDQDF